ncbi:MAG: hypothetical protein R3B82_21535 [Sandaracinaceae bacterium]
MTEPNLDETIQRYFDGELPPDEMEAVRLRLEEDEELAQKLEGLSHLGSMLRATLAPEHVEAPDGDAMFAAIQRALAEPETSAKEADDAEAAPASPGLRVLDGGKKTAPVAPAEAPSRGPIWLGVGAVVLAAAAALWFFVLRPAQTTPGGEGSDRVATAEPPPGSEVEEVDFGWSTGAIFQVEDEGAQYAVVWISDEKPPELQPPANPDEDEDRIQ